MSFFGICSSFVYNLIHYYLLNIIDNIAIADIVPNIIFKHFIYETGVKNKPSGPGAKVAPGGGNSARIGNVTTAQKSGKKSRKGFLGRLLGRSNKSSKASGSSSPGRQPGQPSAGEPKGDKDGKKTAPGETDPRDRP